MPKIDPSQLLDCLDSLLGSDGGIKGDTEVKRLVVLMTKFSKKLVSKCIYILILKSTEPDLLAKFMAEGGWALVFQWLDEGICNNNYPLIREILELLLKCPISLDRLKENNCPKVVKGLSKDSESEEVKKLAGKLVEQWLKFIKSGQAAISDVAIQAAVSKPSITVLPSTIKVVTTGPLNSATTTEVKKSATVKKISSKPGIRIIQKTPSGDEEGMEEVEEEEEDEEVEEETEGKVVSQIGSLPLYRITVRDGKSVFAKVGTKTLTIPVAKNADGEIKGNSVTSVVLKSDGVTKKFRYVTKAVSEKEKVETDESLVRDKTEVTKLVPSEVVAKQKIVLMEKQEVEKVEDNDEQEKLKGSESKSKHLSSKSHKDGNKLKDSGDKILKTGKEHESSKSDSKHKDKDKRSNRDSEKDKKKGDHRSYKGDKSRDRDRDRDREKDKIRNKDSSREKYKDGGKIKSKEKPSKEKNGKAPEKVFSAAEKAQIQADKDKNTLEKLKTPAISLLGKIPKKPSSQGPSVPGKPAAEAVGNTKEPESPVEETKKPSEVTRTSGIRPKTVKTFNSKFRSTGLEEEIKPPPPRNSLKKKVDEKRPLTGSLKVPSVAQPKEGQPPEKKPKVSDFISEVKKEKVLEKPGGVKIIPPKPKPTLLESDMFSDALTASTKMEPRKRKRRISSSKDGSETSAKKEVKEEVTSPEVTSPKDIKPALKFYRDTLEEDEEKSKETSSDVKTEPKTESDSEESAKQNPSRECQENSKPVFKLYPNGVLVYKSRKGPKKSVKWKEDSELTAVRLFELDETERVNVTRTFVDMKLMERSHEREAFQLARKLATEDIMEEKIPWGPLYEVDIPSDRRSTVEPGKSSLEKSVQYAREKTVLQAIYFHRSSIPDSPAEPDPEVHPTTDPKIIPLDDITGNSDSVSNFTNIPWPEPKPALTPSSPPPPAASQQLPGQHQQLSHPQPMPHPQGFGPGFSNLGSFPSYPQMGMPGMMPPGQNTWRSGEGKDMGMNMPFQPNGPLMGPQIGQGPNLFNAGGPEGFPMNGPPMGNFNSGFPMPCEPMYPPPMGGMGMGGPPPPGQWNRGGGGWQGGRPFMGPMNMQPKYQKGVCHHFAKFGNCARGSSCRFMHPN